MAYNTPYNPYLPYNNYGFGNPAYMPNQPMQGNPNPYTMPQQVQAQQQQSIPANNQQMNANVMQQNQPVMNQQIQMNPMQGISASSRVVASREESSAVPADFSGAPIIMPMLVNGEVSAIYVKQWDISRGQANFAEFYKQQPQQQQVENNQPQPQVTFATMENIQSIQGYINDLQGHIEQLEEEIGRIKNRPMTTPKPSNKKDKVTDVSD